MKLEQIIRSNKVLYCFAVKLMKKKERFIFYIIRLLNIPFKFKLINGSKIKFYPKGQIALSMFSERFERNELKIFQKIIKPGMVVFDAGANIGLYSLIAGKLVGKKGKVFSFEPSKETFKRLQNNVRLNGSLNIKIFNEGLGDKSNEKLTLRQDKGYGDAERYLLPANEASDTELQNTNPIANEEQILISTLDNKVGEMRIEKIDFLKIDTEGFEYYILKGATKV